MTALLGALCTDGIVIGADSSATFSAGPHFNTIEQPTEKLDLIGTEIIIAGTGPIGLGQRFKRILDKAHKEKHFGKGHDAIDLCRQLASLAIQDFGTTSAQLGQYGAIVGFALGPTFHLCEFATADFQPELKMNWPKVWFVTMGSAQAITDPVFALLRDVYWSNSQPNVREATFGILWALEHAIECNPGGVNKPARLAVMQPDGETLKARVLTDADLAEHRQAIDQAKNALRTALPGVSPADVAGAPTVPKPSGA